MGTLLKYCHGFIVKENVLSNIFSSYKHEREFSIELYRIFYNSQIIEKKSGISEGIISFDVAIQHLMMCLNQGFVRSELIWFITTFTEIMGFYSCL